jgi:hypothetical protein
LTWQYFSLGACASLLASGLVVSAMVSVQ